MLKCGNRIQLTVKERKFLELCTEVICNPQTEEDLLAWIEYAKKQLTLVEPEERLMVSCSTCSVRVPSSNFLHGQCDYQWRMR